MTIKEFQALNVKRNPIAFPQCEGWEAIDWSNALAGEVGEVCNKVKKLKRDGRTVERLDAVAKELADVVTYATLLADHLGIDLEEACIHKFNEVSVRTAYPLRLVP